MKDISDTIFVLAKGYTPDVGGIERYSAEMVDHYALRFQRAYVVTQTSKGPIVRKSENKIIIDVGSGSQLIVFIRFLLALRRLFSIRSPDFIHATTWRAAIPVLFLKKQSPMVVTVHGREVFIVTKILRPIMRYILAHCQAVAVVSDAIRHTYSSTTGCNTKNWVVTWNGITFPKEANSFTPSRDSASFRIFSFCRLVERKNIHGAILAISNLFARGVDNFTFDIAGVGPERTKLEKLARDVGVSHKVRFIGYVSDAEIIDYYKSSHIFLHPQIAASGGGDIEGFGLTIADAMSFGVAVIAGRDGGPSDFVRHGETGLIVDGTDVAAITAALEYLISNPERCRDIACSGRAWSLTHLSWSNAVEQIVSSLKSAN